jgi:hypothetical protein
MSISKRFDRALTASKNPAEFAALFQEPEMDANMVSPITRLPLIVHLIINCRDEQLPAVLAVLVRNYVNLRLEVNNRSIPLGTAAANAKKLAYDFLLLHTDKALINRPMHEPVMVAVAQLDTINIKNTLLILKDLIEVQNADIDIRDSIGNTVLCAATRHMRPKVLNYLLAKKANIWLGRALPLITAFTTWHSLKNSYPPIDQRSEKALKTLAQYETCLKALVSATYNYFYHFAARYDGTPEELQSELSAWENYIEAQINNGGNPNVNTQFRNLLRQDIFDPVFKLIQLEKTQRLPICRSFHKLANASQNQLQNQTFDINLISEVFSYIFAASPRSLSCKETWLAAFQQTLLKVNMAPKEYNKGIWYFLDYREYMDNTIRRYDEKYAEGYANDNYWEMTAPFVYKIKAGVLPVTALQAFLTGLTIADCGSVLVACQYAALLKMIGAEKFNIMFAADTAPLTISRFIYDHTNPISYFFTRSGEAVTSGDMCYFSGLDYFSKKHPLGHARGWSVVCTGKNSCGENLYYGFGRDDFKVSSMAQKDLEQIMLNIYNLPRDKYNQEWIKKQTLAEQYDLAQQHIPIQFTYTEAISALQGYEPNSTVTPDYVKISKYQQKEALTEDEFIEDYDNFLCAGRYPSFFSRPTSMVIELPDVPEDEKRQSPPTSPRVGIPTLRY